VRDARLVAYASQFTSWLMYRHALYLAIATALGVFIAIYRPLDALVWLFLLGAAVLFTLSWVVIGLACDFRYLYFLPVAVGLSLVGLTVTTWPTPVRKKDLSSDDLRRDGGR
jgi:hypothetical protein